jgi:hypothetical protein
MSNLRALLIALTILAMAAAPLLVPSIGLGSPASQSAYAAPGAAPAGQNDDDDGNNDGDDGNNDGLNRLRASVQALRSRGCRTGLRELHLSAGVTKPSASRRSVEHGHNFLDTSKSCCNGCNSCFLHASC